jgi:hypothetical protein
MMSGGLFTDDDAAIIGSIRECIRGAGSIKKVVFTNAGSAGVNDASSWKLATLWAATRRKAINAMSLMVCEAVDQRIGAKVMCDIIRQLFPPTGVPGFVFTSAPPSLAARVLDIRDSCRDAASVCIDQAECLILSDQLQDVLDKVPCGCGDGDGCVKCCGERFVDHPAIANLRHERHFWGNWSVELLADALCQRTQILDVTHGYLS